MATLILSVLAVPLSRSQREGRYGRLDGLLVFIIYFNLMSAGTAWLEQGTVSPLVGIWWVHALMLAIALTLLGVQNGVHRRILQGRCVVSLLTTASCTILASTLMVLLVLRSVASSGSSASSRTRRPTTASLRRPFGCPIAATVVQVLPVQMISSLRPEHCDNGEIIFIRTATCQSPAWRNGRDHRTGDDLRRWSPSSWVRRSTILHAPCVMRLAPGMSVRPPAMLPGSRTAK
jgi:hypothetical protein